LEFLENLHKISEGEIIEISHRAVIPDNSYGIPELRRNSWNSTKIPELPMEFYANFQGIPKKIQIIPWNSREFQNRSWNPI
jgi:hypothetical protein